MNNFAKEIQSAGHTTQAQQRFDQAPEQLGGKTLEMRNRLAEQYIER